MHKSNKSRETDTFRNAADNCHRTGMKNTKKPTSDSEKTASDQDSTNSKYLVDEDNRKRKDGPGGD